MGHCWSVLGCAWRSPASNHRLHDLRHIWGSTGVRLGLPLELLGRVVGHKHIATTQGYAHLDTDPLSAIAASVAERLQQALGS